MSLRGQLETSDFATLLQLLYHEKKTGVLEVSDGNNEVKIFVSDGNIARASSSHKKRGLGYLLRAKGVVSAKQLHKCLEMAKEQKQRVGSLLIEKGYVSTAQLKKFLRYQAREIICDVFLWKTGQFEYEDVPVRIETRPVPVMNTMEIILEASRRIDEWSVIKKQIPDDGLVFKLVEGTEKKQESKLTKKERHMLSLIDGVRTVRQMVEESKYQELAAHKIIHSLIASGLIEKAKVVRDERDEEGEAVDYARIVKIYMDILRVIHRHLEPEVGKRVFTLFEECKAALPPKQRSIFEKLDMKKPVGTNMVAMLKVLDTFQNSEQGILFLSRGFNVFLQGILQKEEELLGQEMTRRTLKEAQGALSYWQDHQKESDERVETLDEVQRIMEQVHHRMTE